MRTTIDIPDDVLRRAKARAALSGMKLKDLITRYVEMGLAQHAQEGEQKAHPRRSPPPLIAKAMTGKPIPALTNQELAELELEEDYEKLRRPTGR